MRNNYREQGGTCLLADKDVVDFKSCFHNCKFEIFCLARFRDGELDVVSVSVMITSDGCIVLFPWSSGDHSQMSCHSCHV